MVNVTANFDYTANFGPVIGQMELLARQANVLNNTLQNLDKQAVSVKSTLASSFASDLGKIGGWNAKMVELTDNVDEFGQKLLKQKLTLREYAQEAISSFSKTSNAHKLAVREVSREMSQLVTLGKGMDGKQLGMMITPATINLKDLNTQLAVSQKQWSIFNNLVQDGSTHLINFGKNTQWAGRQITVGLTVPLTIYGNTVSKIFREVDAELTRFQKVYGGDLMNSTSDATKKMTDDVKQLAIEFSKSMGIAAKDTASLAADLAATGLEGQKLLASIRETTRLAVLGDVSNQEAMKTTLSLQNAFKMNTDELAKSVNFLNAVENQTSLSLQDLTTAIPKAGPVIKSLGGDVKDLSVLMVALKEGGISAAEGANAIKSGMASLINPTKKAAQVAKQYGIDVNNIVQTNRGQLMPTIMEFQKQLSTLDEFGKAQVIENVFGKYQFARMSALFDNLNANASQTNQVLSLMGKSSRELAATAYQEMDTLMNSSSKRFQRAIEGIKAQFISIGGSITTAVTPILENLVGKIQKAIDFFQNLPKPIKSFIKVAAGLTAVAGPIIMMVGIFSNFMGYVAKGAMGVVNLGRKMAGIPTQKFEMLTDTQIMAQKATDQLANSFDHQRSSVERLNQALLLYKKNLSDAITLNPAFLNRQVAAETVTGNPPVPKFQKGGRVNGYASNSGAWVPGKGSGDKVPALLEPGEYVVNRNAASKFSTQLDSMNYQSAPRFQKGGRVAGYADKSYGPEDFQAALKAWIMPMLSGLAPFNNPNKDVYRPAGEKYAGFFRDIFMQESSKGIGPQELMRAETWYKKGQSDIRGTNGASSTVSFMNRGAPLDLFQYRGGEPITLDLKGSGRFTSYSDLLDTVKLRENYMKVFKTKGLQQRSIDANKRKLTAGEILPYFIHLIRSDMQGIDVNKNFKGQSYYGNEGEFILSPNQQFPITGFGNDIATRLPIIHSIQSGSTRMINGRPVQVAQRGGRINGYANQSKSFMFPGIKTREIDFTHWKDMEGIQATMGIGGIDRKEGMVWKQVRQHPSGKLIKDAMIQEAIFSQLLNSGLFGTNVGGVDQSIYNAVSKKGVNFPILGGKFLKGFKSGGGKTSSAAIDAMLAGAIIGNSDLHEGNFGLHNGKIHLIDNTDNLFFDPVAGTKNMTESLNYFEGGHSLSDAGFRQAGKMQGRGNTYIQKYLQSVSKKLQSNKYIDIAIKKATQGSPEMLDSLNKFGEKRSGRKGSNYSDLLRTILSMRTTQLMNELNLDELDSLGMFLNEDAKDMRLPKDLRLQSHADTSMPPSYAEKQSMIEGFLSETHNEATTGRFAGMPLTDVGTRTSGMGGFSSLIPGANGVYEVGGKKYVVKSHSSAESALIEQRGTQLTRAIFGLETPIQEFIKFAHPNTGQTLFGVRSPYNPVFANPTGEIGPQNFFMQALSAIIRGDGDLQPDNLFGNVVGDVGAGYVSDRAAQPRKLSGKRADVATQAKVNFLMVKGGAKKWFAEATAGLAASMSPEEYSIGFQQAIDLALSHAPAALAGLGNLTPEEQAMYSTIISDLEAARSIDWQAIHAHHSSLSPTIKKPANPPTAAALAKKQAEKAELQQALAAGFPEWMLAGRASQTGFSVRSAAEGMGEQSKKLVTTLARMNPPHAGHGILLDQAYNFAKSTGADFRFSLSSKEGDAKNPFTVAEKYDLFRMMFPQYVPFLEANDTTSISGKIKEWAAQGYSQVDLFLGSDQVPKFQNFFPISARKAGMKGIVHDVVRPEGALSATALRAAIATGDAKGILPFLPAGLAPKQQQAIIKKLLGKRTQMLESHAGDSKLWDPQSLFGQSGAENRTIHEIHQNLALRKSVLDFFTKNKIAKTDSSFVAIEKDLSPTGMGAQKNLSSWLEKMLDSGLFNGWQSKKTLLGNLAAAIELPKFRKKQANPLSHYDSNLKKTFSKKLPAGENWRIARDSSYLASMGLDLPKDYSSVRTQALDFAERVADSAINRSPDDIITNDAKLREKILLGIGFNKQASSKFVGDAAHAFQSGGRVNGYATSSRVEVQSDWNKKAAAPKAYAGILRSIPDWATKGAEYQAILEALRASGIDGSDRLASYYIQDVLAHINPSTTNANGVYEKVWAAANLMKDSQVYNVFLETINSRKDVGGLLNPATVARVVADSGLPRPIALTELTRIADGVHPNTANGARVMMSLARLFPSRTSPGITTAVAAGMGARLGGNFYDTLGSRALPAGLPTITVRSYSPTGGAQPTSRTQGSRVNASGMVLPSGAIKQGMVLPTIQSLSSYAGGTGTKATVRVDGMGNVLSNGIDDMVANTITGQPIAVSSKELLAISPSGGIAGVTSPGDEARGNIIHPVGTALMRGKKFQQIRSAANGMEPVYDQSVRSGSMQRFASSMFMMTGVVQQAMFALQQFTSETQNGTSKLVAGGELLTSGLSMLGENAGSGLIKRGRAFSAFGSNKLQTGIGSALQGAGKAVNFLGNPLTQIGVQAAIMGVNKVIEIYQKAMEKARVAGVAAFSEPTETAKLLGIQINSLTASSEAYAKQAQSLFGTQGRGAYDKVFADTINKDYKDLVDTIKSANSEQMQMNKLTQTYASLVMRGIDLKQAKEITAEIARQAEAISAFNSAVGQFNAIKDAATATETLSKSIVTNLDLIKQWEAETKAKENYSLSQGFSPAHMAEQWISKIFADKKANQEMASMLVGGLKEAFSVASTDPVAANEATKMIISQFKNVDKGKIKEELTGMLSDAGFGKFSKTFQLVDSGKFDALAKTLGENAQQTILTAVQAGNGKVLEEMLNNGELTQDNIDKLNQLNLAAEAAMAIKAKIDFETKENIDSLNKLKDAVQREMDIAIEAKQTELAAEDKRHEKAMKNLDNESERLNEKKRILQENTDYYLKQLQKEKAAEDYYAQQRQTAIGGLSAISKGDIFGFIGAQQQAATQSDQFGRDRDLQNIQDTADAEQKKLDAALRGIDNRRKAEDARHQKEMDNINNEITALQKKKSTTSSLIDTAIASSQKVLDMQAGVIPSDQKSLANATKQAAADVQAAVKAGIDIQKYLPKNINEDSKNAANQAKKDALDALAVLQTGWDDALAYVTSESGKLSAASKAIFDDVAKSLGISLTDFSSGLVTNLGQVNEAGIPASNALKMVALALQGFQIDGSGNLTSTSAVHTSQYGKVSKATGGHITGAGTGTSDSIPARLSNGEFVVRADAVKQYGVGMLNSINEQKFADGGLVLDPSTKQKIALAEKIWGKKYNIVKGGYRKADSLSGGTHTGGGVFDAYYNGGSSLFPEAAVMALRKAGFAAWNRWQFGKNNQHIHAVEIGNRNLSRSAAGQVASYQKGGNGLGGKDVISRPRISSPASIISAAPSEGMSDIVSAYNAQRLAAGGFVTPSAPTYDIPQSGISAPAVAQMAGGGAAGMSNSSADNNAAYNFHFNGAGMDMVMNHVNKAIGGRMSNNSRRVG